MGNGEWVMLLSYYLFPITYYLIPFRNIDRPIHISIPMPPAMTTLKLLLTSQPDMVADVASLACVGRIHRYNLR